MYSASDLTLVLNNDNFDPDYSCLRNGVPDLKWLVPGCLLKFCRPSSIRK